MSVDVPDDEWEEQIAIGVHTGLRKGSEAPSSGPLWTAIYKSDDGAWSDAVRFCVDGMKSMGYRLVRDTDTDTDTGEVAHGQEA